MSQEEASSPQLLPTYINQEENGQSFSVFKKEANAFYRLASRGPSKWIAKD